MTSSQNQTHPSSFKELLGTELQSFSLAISEARKSSVPIDIGEMGGFSQ